MAGPYILNLQHGIGLIPTEISLDIHRRLRLDTKGKQTHYQKERCIDISLPSSIVRRQIRIFLVQTLTWFPIIAIVQGSIRRRALFICV